MPTDRARSRQLVDVIAGELADLIASDERAVRRRLRATAADPFAFYRGTACVFYADVRERDDPWADERTGRVWIQGELHAENFGTYMDGQGVLIFDVNEMKQGGVPALTRIAPDHRAERYFEHEGHRTAVSQRTLQAHSDPWLGWARMTGGAHDGVGFVVKELSPYEADLDWSALTEADEMADVLEQLGRATAKVHCVSDVDATDAPLVDFQTEEAIVDVVSGREDELVNDLVTFGLEYGGRVREDHDLFVDAFRGGQIEGVGPSSS